MTDTNISASILIALVSATFGALSVGIFRLFEEQAKRGREAQAILKAFAADVRALTWIIRLHYHPDRWRGLADRVEAGERVALVLDLSQDHFGIHDRLIGEVGKLPAPHVEVIVSFYALCRMVIETVGRQSTYRLKPQNMRFAADLLERILMLGDRIVRFPRDKPLVNDFAWPYDDSKVATVLAGAE